MTDKAWSPLMDILTYSCITFPVAYLFFIALQQLGLWNWQL
ncbi:hypothetical protein [Litchfieldia alkalitelluris]|nr:hypothetical protein [Litchfieldia alkalitelluris]